MLTKVTNDLLNLGADTSSLNLPKGTTAQRPSSPVAGMVRENTDDNVIEYYNGTEWKQVLSATLPVSLDYLIAAGGGGVPVYRDDKKNLVGVEAVIDKDLASSLLAKEIGAEAFFILTDVPNVYLNFNKPNQIKLEKITVREAEEYFGKGEFADGSMGPKILAAIQFVKNGGKETIITDSTQLANPDSGTRIVGENY